VSRIRTTVRGIMPEVSCLFRIDVDKSSYHHLSQREIFGRWHHAGSSSLPHGSRRIAPDAERARLLRVFFCGFDVFRSRLFAEHAALPQITFPINGVRPKSGAESILCNPLIQRRCRRFRLFGRCLLVNLVCLPVSFFTQRAFDVLGCCEVDVSGTYATMFHADTLPKNTEGLGFIRPFPEIRFIGPATVKLRCARPERGNHIGVNIARFC